MSIPKLTEVKVQLDSSCFIVKAEDFQSTLSGIFITDDRDDEGNPLVREFYPIQRVRSITKFYEVSEPKPDRSYVQESHFHSRENASTVMAHPWSSTGRERDPHVHDFEFTPVEFD